MSKPDFTKPKFNISKDFRVRISQVPPMDVAFQSMTLTDYELLVATIYKLNELISQTNSYTELIEEILEWVLNAGLNQAVLEQLTLWLNDGTLETLINETLFNMKLDKSEFEDYKLVVNQALKDLNDEISRIDSDLNDLNVEISRIDSDLDDLDNKKIDKIFDGQTDYVNKINDLCYISEKIDVYCIDKTKEKYSVISKTKNGRGIQYDFEKYSVYDYATLRGGKVGKIVDDYVLAYVANYDTRNGTFFEGVKDYYTETVGDTITFSFYGSKVSFNYLMNNTGGIWEFVIDGDTDNKIIVSTFLNQSIGKYGNTVLFENNEKDNHVIVGTFKGADPNNPPVDDRNPRGWLLYGIETTFSKTFEVSNNIIKVDEETPILYAESNKEFAINVKKNGDVGETHFVPDHSGVQTTIAIENVKTYINGDEVSLSNGDFIEDIDEFKIVQFIYGKNPNTPENLMKVISTHTFKKGKVEMNVSVDYLEDVFISTGFGIMIPLSNKIINKVITSIGNEFKTKTDGKEEYLIEEKDLATSFVGLSETNKDVAVGCTINNPTSSLRWGEDGKDVETLRTWVQHRNDKLVKIYPEVYKNATIPKGSKYKISGTIIIGDGTNLYEQI